MDVHGQYVEAFFTRFENYLVCLTPSMQLILALACLLHEEIVPMAAVKNPKTVEVIGERRCQKT